MTIKEFARLCGCNPQTLRYYDHVELLKPVEVDRWSGYRYYEEKQALAFVKIKNLQKAGFTIEEIKGLLDKDDHAIYEALDAKIAETEERLQVIKEIRRSYHNEMNEITKKINEMRMIIAENMKIFNEYFLGGVQILYDEFVQQCVDDDSYLNRLYSYVKRFNDEQNGDALKASIDNLLNR